MKKKSLITAFIIIAVILVAIIAVTTANNNQDGNNTADNITDETADNIEDTEENPFDNFEYAEGISGFYSDYDSESDESIYGLTLPYESSTYDFQIVNIGRYTGGFMEDGSDDSVVNVLAMLIKNTSDKMLEFLEIRFEDEDGNIYTFDISALPAGKKCLVLESSKTVYSDGVSLTFKEIIPVYKDDVDMMSDEIEFSVVYPEETGDPTDITLTNIGERDIDSVFLCYKTSENGIYIGGVAYRVEYEELQKGASLTESVTHFYEGASSIMFIEEGE